jgi:hypothetical protein
MSYKKPVPLVAVRARKPCPICGLPSYSASGTHPQCMQRSNDRLAKQIVAGGQKTAK